MSDRTKRILNWAVPALLVIAIVLAVWVSEDYAQPPAEGYALAYVQCDTAFIKQKDCGLALACSVNLWLTAHPGVNNVRVMPIRGIKGKVPWGAFILYEN